MRPSGATGGTDPIQVGLGVQLAGTSTNFAQGSNQYTGRTSDLLINGDGFFVLNHGGQQTYTGPVPSASTLPVSWSSPDGSIVQSAAGGNLNLAALNSGTYVSWSISPLGVVNGVDSTGATTALGTIATATFANPGGLAKIGDTQYETTANSGAAADRRTRLRWPGHADRRLPGDVERRPGLRADQPDHLRARVPGQLPGDHHLGRGLQSLISLKQ